MPKQDFGQLNTDFKDYIRLQKKKKKFTKHVKNY